jgi:hypothetical protein
MDQDALLRLGIFLSGILFAAGAYAASSRMTRRQVNGLGRKYNWLLAYLSERTDNKADQKAIADIIRGNVNGNGKL